MKKLLKEAMETYAKEHNITYQQLLDVCIDTGFKAVKEMGSTCCSEQVRIICKEWNEGRT